MLSLEEGASVYATASPDFYNPESDEIEEIFLTADLTIKIKHPNALFVTARASDQGKASNFRLLS